MTERDEKQIRFPVQQQAGKEPTQAWIKLNLKVIRDKRKDFTLYVFPNSRDTS